MVILMSVAALSYLGVDIKVPSRHLSLQLEIFVFVCYEKYPWKLL